MIIRYALALSRPRNRFGGEWRSGRPNPPMNVEVLIARTRAITFSEVDRGSVRGISRAQVRDRQGRCTSWIVFALGFIFAHALVACGGGGNGQSAATVTPPTAQTPPVPPPVVTPESGDARQGRYVGTVTIGGVDYYGDALITADGLIRLYIGGPYASDGVVQGPIAIASAQLFGTMAPSTNSVDGDDLVFGQGCSAPVELPMVFCSAPAHASHSLAIDSGNLQGQIVVRMPDSEGDTETWTLELSPWSGYYNLRATQAALAGHYKEERADFAQDGDTVISIDADGNLSFQSVGSGCTGSGRLRPHLDGSVNVYDVLILISGCQPPYDYLNAEFSGLATTSPSAAWDYDVNLQMWLTQINPDIWDSPPPALTMLGRLQ